MRDQFSGFAPSVAPSSPSAIAFRSLPAHWCAMWLALLCLVVTRGASAQTACAPGMSASVDTDGHCCWPGQAWSHGRALCVGVPTCPAGFLSQGEACAPVPAPPPPMPPAPPPVTLSVAPVAPACANGMTATADTAGHCCWPIQVWSTTQQRCVGMPQCPAGTTAQGEACVVAPCPAGEFITADTAGHCCWPAQAYSSSLQRCVGVPQCAPGTVAQGESCLPVQAQTYPTSLPVIAPGYPGAPSPVVPMAAVARPNVPPATGSYAQRYAGATVLTFTNHGHQPICEVDISPASDREFGDNWLAAGEQIMPEASRTFAIQGGGRWDIRAYDCRHRMVVAGPTLRLGDLNPSVSLSANGRGGGGALIALGLAEEIGGTLAWDLGSENGIRYGLGATLWICGALSLGVGIAVLASPGSRLELDHDGSQRRYRARTGVQFAGFDAAPVPGGGLVSAVRFQF